MITLKTIYIRSSQASLLIPIITGIRKRKVLTKPFRILLYFFMLSLLFEVASSFAKRIYHNNMPLQHTFTVIEFITFSLVFYFHMRKNSILRRLIIANIVVHVGIAIADATDAKGILTSNDMSRTYSSVSLILYALLFYFHLFRKDDIVYIWEYPMFWICTGVLVYFAGNSFYVMLKDYLLDHHSSTEWIGHLTHALLNIIANCLYAQSFKCLKEQTIVS